MNGDFPYFQIPIRFPQLDQALGMLQTIIRQGEKIMAKADDIRQSQAGTDTALDRLSQEQQALLTEVNELLALVQAAGDIPQDIVDKSAAIQVRAQGIADAFAQIPPSPTPPQG